MNIDKYNIKQDPNCYPDSDVLKNRFNLRNDQDLNEVEYYLSDKAAQKLEFQEPPYSLDTLRYIHRSLFADIYDWAGNTRSVKISKGSTQFCTPVRIEPEGKKEFDRIASANWFEGYPRDSLVAAVAKAYGTLNVIHPFREGNGRAQRILFEWLIINAGYGISWWKVDQAEWILANIKSFYGDDSHLTEVFNRCIGLPIPPSLSP